MADLSPQPPGPSNVIVVSLKDMYDTLIALVSKVDLLIAQHTDLGKDLADHENRIRSLERGRWPLPAVGALTGLAGLIVAVLALMWKK